MSESTNNLNNAKFVELGEGVRQILSYPFESLDLRTYMRLYTLIHNYCTAQKSTATTATNTNTNTNRNGNGNISGTRGAHLLGEELYYWLDDYIRHHLLQLHLEIVAQPENVLTAFYLERWRCYKAAAAYMNHLFRFLNRHWVKREMDEGHTQGIHEIYDLCLVCWKEIILENTENPVNALLQQHIETAEDSWIVVSPTAPELLESFASLNISVNSSG